jgi:DNA-binding response OmpR family regulator
MRVLIVEDEAKISAAIKRVLTAERYSADVADDGVAALALAESHDYDIIVLDRLLPDLEGMEVLRLLRARGADTPVLMLTALDAIDDRVAGLDAGADDYLAKPFAFRELLGRMRALARRSPEQPAESLRAGDIELDPLRHRVTVAGASEDLSAREYALPRLPDTRARSRRDPAADPRRRLGCRARRLLQRRGSVRPLRSPKAGNAWA